MRSRSVAILVALVGVACTAKTETPADTNTASAQGVTSPPADRAADEAAIRQMDDQFFAAVKAKDAAAAAALYAADAISMPPNSPPLMGRDAVMKYNADFFKAPQLAMTGESESIKFSDDGTVAYETGKYSATFADAKGKIIKDEGKFLNVMKKIDGKWRIVADAFSSNMPAGQ